MGRRVSPDNLRVNEGLAGHEIRVEPGMQRRDSFNNLLPAGDQ